MRATVMVFHWHNSCVYNCCGMNDSRDVPATELRSNLAAYLDEARAGGTVVVTRSGRPAARLVPPDLDGESDAPED
jgi:prevent-host-death family protein